MKSKNISFVLDGYPGKDLYIQRTDRHNLESRCNLQLESGHIFLYGDSKNGKTSLVNSIFDGKNPVFLLCSGLESIHDIYRQIYRELGLNDCEIENEGGFSFWGFLVGKRRVTKRLTYELDINSIISHMIQQDRKYLVLDDVHYLSESVQKKLAITLKAFSGKGIKVALIGVKDKIEKNKFFIFNPDLRGRLEYIEVEPMSRAIIGALLRQLLNITGLKLGDSAINYIIGKVERQPYMVVRAVHILHNEINESRRKNKKRITQQETHRILESYAFGALDRQSTN
jgi:hypothetical protein